MTAPSSPPAPAPRIVHLVDDDEVLRRSVALMLTRHNLQTRLYGSAEQFLAALDEVAPGCLVVDLRMPGMNGFALLQELNRRGVGLPVILVTGHAEVAMAVQAMKAGAVDFLEKPYGEKALLAAIALAFERLEEDHADLSRSTRAAARVATLSPREREVLLGLGEGHANKVIAASLGISPRTVEIHRARVMEKLGCRSLAEVLRIVIEARLDQP